MTTPDLTPQVPEAAPAAIAGNVGAKAIEGAVAPSPVATPGTYDHLFDTSLPEPSVPTAAAVTPDSRNLLPSERNYINVAPPPTDAQIATAKEHGFDLAKQAKYFSKDAWANRNNKQ